MTADGTHIGIVQFGAPFGNIRTSVESQLTGSLSSLLQSIPNIQQIQGSTPAGVGLEFAQLEVFLKSGRPSHPHAMVLITDGKSNLGVNPIQVATTLKSSKYNVSIICVGVGQSIDLPELQAIASPPISLTVFAVSDWPALQAFLKTVVSTTCNVVCPGDCSQHGQCITSNATCVCNPGYNGPSCNSTTPTCPGTPPCSNHGTCDPNGTCTCDSRWTGIDCSQPVCPGNPPCGGNGHCVNGTCVCSSGYSGEFCCPGNQVCNNNGKCLSNGTCACNPGSDGPACQPPTQCPGGCGHGFCQNGTCVCPPIWNPPYCNTTSYKKCQTNDKCLQGCCQALNTCLQGCQGGPACIATCQEVFADCTVGCTDQQVSYN